VVVACPANKGGRGLVFMYADSIEKTLELFHPHAQKKPWST
jgi:hypothetical protein